MRLKESEPQTGRVRMRVSSSLLDGGQRLAGVERIAIDGHEAAIQGIRGLSLATPGGLQNLSSPLMSILLFPVYFCVMLLGAVSDTLQPGLTNRP